MTPPNWLCAAGNADGLRLWAMRGAEVVARRVAARPDETALAELRSEWPDLPLLLDPPAGWPGMAEPRLLPAPAGTTVIQQGDLWLVQPLAQRDPPAVLFEGAPRIAGLLAAQPGFDGTALLTGSRSHWVRVSAEEICNFNSFLTAQLMPLTFGGDPGQGFDAAVEDGLSRPHRAFAALAAAHDSGDAWRLAGLLIGIELAAAKPWWLGEHVAILGAAPWADLYARALTAQGATILQPDAEAAWLAGMFRAWSNLTAPDSTKSQPVQRG